MEFQAERTERELCFSYLVALTLDFVFNIKQAILMIYVLKVSFVK